MKIKYVPPFIFKDLVMHDSLKSKSIIADSIDYLSEEVNRKGYTFGSPEECLR